MSSPGTQRAPWICFSMGPSIFAVCKHRNELQSTAKLQPALKWWETNHSYVWDMQFPHREISVDLLQNRQRVFCLAFSRWRALSKGHRQRIFFSEEFQGGCLMLILCSELSGCPVHFFFQLNFVIAHVFLLWSTNRMEEDGAERCGRNSPWSWVLEMMDSFLATVYKCLPWASAV